MPCFAAAKVWGFPYYNYTPPCWRWAKISTYGLILRTTSLLE